MQNFYYEPTRIGTEKFLTTNHTNQHEQYEMKKIQERYYVGI